MEKKIKAESGVEIIATPAQAKRFLEEFNDQLELITTRLWNMSPSELKRVLDFVNEIDHGN